MTKAPTSKKTDLNQVAAIHRQLRKKIENKCPIILDYGSGKALKTIKFWEEGSTALYRPYDPHNRLEKDNKEALSDIRTLGGADIIILANVLNVIRFPRAREGVLRKCKSLLRKGGSIWIQIYKASRTANYSGALGHVGQKTTKGWQNCQPISYYFDEIKTVFPKAEKVGAYIKAEL